MPPAPYAESLRRFARDLSALREAQGVTIERIHQQSKIPLHVLQDFEADALLGNPVFNRVYLRSLVKTYADSLRLPISEVLGALESAYAGEAKSLRYLGPRSLDALADDPAPAATPPPKASKPAKSAPPAPVTPAPPVPVDAADAHSEPANGESTPPPVTQGPDDAPGESVVPVAAATAAVDATLPASLVSPEPPSAPTPVRSASATAPPNAAPSAPPPASPPAAPPVRSAPPVTTAGRAFTGSYSAAVEPRRMPSWLPAVLGVVALLVAIGGLLWWLGRDPETADRPAAPTAAAPSDTAAARRPAPAAAPTPPVALPDTLVLTVRATTEPLRGIRIRRDDDVRRPYWIEAGREQAFAFRDSAFVTAADWPTAAYLLNGAPLDAASVRAADGTLVLVRDRLARR